MKRLISSGMLQIKIFKEIFSFFDFEKRINIISVAPGTRPKGGTAHHCAEKINTNGQISKKILDLEQSRFGRDRNIVSLIYVILSILIASISVGINVVVFPAILIENNVDSFLIGLATAIEIIFSFFAAIFVGRFLARFGAIKSLIFVTIAYSTILYFIFYYQNYLVWLAVEALIGLCWISLYIIKQAWVNSLISDKNRSIILALLTSIFCLGFTGGASIVKILGALDHLCLIISSILTFLSGMMLVLIKDTFPKNIDSEHIKFKTLWQKLPNDTLARFLLDFQAGCLIFLGVLFGVKAGFSAENSGLLIAAFMASGIFDLYAGLLVKFYDRVKIIAYGFLGCLLTIGLSMVFYQEFYILLTCFFFFGMSCALIMVATITNLNDSFDKSQLVAANGTFQAVGSLGTVLGCLTGAIMIKLFDLNGFFITILSAIIVYIIYFIFFARNNVGNLKSLKK